MLNTYCIHLHTGSKRKQRRRHAIEFVATRLYVCDIGFGIEFSTLSGVWDRVKYYFCWGIGVESSVTFTYAECVNQQQQQYNAVVDRFT